MKNILTKTKKLKQKTFQNSLSADENIEDWDYQYTKQVLRERTFTENMSETK